MNNKVPLMDIFPRVVQRHTDGIDVSIINGLNKPQHQRRKLIRLPKSNGMYHNVTASGPILFQAFRRIPSVNMRTAKRHQ